MHKDSIFCMLDARGSRACSRADAVRSVYGKKHIFFKYLKYILPKSFKLKKPKEEKRKNN